MCTDEISTPTISQPPAACKISLLLVIMVANSSNYLALACTSDSYAFRLCGISLCLFFSEQGLIHWGEMQWCS